MHKSFASRVCNGGLIENTYASTCLYFLFEQTSQIGPIVVCGH